MATSVREQIEALHQPMTVRFVDDDGAQHAPVEVCSTCRVRYPCPTTVSIGSSDDTPDNAPQRQL